MLLAPMVNLMSSGRVLQQAGAHFERLADVFEEPPEESGSGGRRLRSFSGSISLRDVHFSFQRSGEALLRGIDLEIQGSEPRSRGPTGAGMSTLALIFLALFKPQEGEALFDGVPVERLDLRSLRKHCAIVLQEPYLFRGTLAENVRQGDPTINMDDIVDACTRSRIHEEIARLPMGCRPTRGKRRRALRGPATANRHREGARTPRPVFSSWTSDEPPGLPDGARDPRAALNELSMTRIIIAHRLSTLRTMDLILFLDDGRIVERGTHRDLLATGQRYAGLYGMQAQMAS